MDIGKSQTKKSHFSVITKWLCVFVIAANASSATSASTLADISLQNAERLLQFKVMIRATHRRCAILKEPFDQEYKIFYKSLKDKLETSSKVVKSSFSGTHDSQSFDSMLTATANTYGLGHPQHNCRQLKVAIADILELRSETDRFVAIERILIGTPRHNHYNDSIAALVSDQSSRINAPPSGNVKTGSTPTSEPQSLADNAAVAEKRSNTAGSSTSSAKSGSTKDYTGGSRIKDF